MQPEKPSKRLDLQGIRGLAIIVVLGFHFYPNIFPNGYLGVDQFFVLSGFLMCMLLKRGGGGGDNMQSCFLITLFYSKRFKRILPLYLLIILLSLLSLYTIFPDTAIETNLESATNALLFMSNRPKTDQEDYFQMLSIAIDIFTHTWSLSVEVQFYFMVPFMFIVGSKLSHKYQLLYYSIIGVISFVYSSSSSPTVAFNNVFARIWQFVIGMVVYLCDDESRTIEKTENNECSEKLLEEKCEVIEDGMDGTKMDRKVIIIGLKYFILLSLVYIITYPNVLPVVVARPYVTILTGLLMLISMDDYLLSNRILTYIGDISYSLYLIHWPIYAYWKLTMNNNQILLVICLSVSVILAVVSYELFEKNYLKQPLYPVCLFVVALFVSSVLIINKDDITDLLKTSRYNMTSFDGTEGPITLDEAEEFNKKWSIYDKKNLMVKTCEYEKKGPYGWCNHTGLDQNNKYKIMIFGNSYTANHANLFYQECHDKAKILIQGAAQGCEAFYPSKWSLSCPEDFKEFAVRIREYRPDIAFIFARSLGTGWPITGKKDDLSDDKVYQTMKQQLDEFVANIKKKLYILRPLPSVVLSSIKNIVTYLRNGTDLVDIDKSLVTFDKYDSAVRRFDQLFKDCGEKCESISYVPEFYNQDTKTFRYFDETNGLSYFTQSHHLSPHGIEKIRHIYTDICRQL